MRFISRETIDEQAWNLLESTDTVRLPVPVELVAHRLGVGLEEAQLGDGVSGVLIIEEGAATIGYSADQPYVRQRFSIAHELGHYALHRDDPDAPNLFITTRYVAKFMRDAQSSTGEHAREVQANMFAAALLMPAHLVRAEIQRPEYDTLDEEQLVNRLANTFQVSTQALTIRLTALGIIDH